MSGSAPADHSLLPQQFFYDSSGAGKLWVGVPTAVNATGKLLFLDNANVQNKVPIGGGTMTGPLILSADPTNLLGAATKQYVDSKGPLGGPYLLLAGGQMTGTLTLAADPLAPGEAATKRYADKMLPLSGGTLTGALTLPANPTTALQAATKQYADLMLPLVGGTLSGGISFGGVVGASNSDLSKHITLHAAGYGMAVTASRLNIVYGGNAVFVSGGVDRLTVSDTAVTATVPITLPADPTTALQAATRQYVDNKAIGYPQLPAEVSQVPITFGFSGKPATGAIANAPMSMALTIPSGLAGTTAYDTTKTTSPAAFAVNRIVNGTTITQIGTMTVTSASNTAVTLAGSGATLAIGDVLQVVSPSQDVTLSDVAFTILASRV